MEQIQRIVYKVVLRTKPTALSPYCDSGGCGVGTLKTNGFRQHHNEEKSVRRLQIINQQPTTAMSATLVHRIQCRCVVEWVFYMENSVYLCVAMDEPLRKQYPKLRNK